MYMIINGNHNKNFFTWNDILYKLKNDMLKNKKDVTMEKYFSQRKEYYKTDEAIDKYNKQEK